MRLLHLDLTFWSVFSATPRYTDTYGNTCRLHDYINNNEGTRILTSVVICHTYRRLCSFALDFVYCRLKFVCHSLQYFIFCLYLYTLFENIPQTCCGFVLLCQKFSLLYMIPGGSDCWKWVETGQLVTLLINQLKLSTIPIYLQIIKVTITNKTITLTKVIKNT
jgi:hypothetical protein